MSKFRFFSGGNCFLWYSVYFLLLFCQFPLRGSLPGNVDTWYYLAIFNDFGNLLFGESIYGTSLYPVKQAFLLGEPSFIPGIIFVFFKLLFSSDLLAYYLFISVTYSLNSISVYSLCRSIGIDRMAAFAGGFFYGNAAFMLGNIENQNAVFGSAGIFAVALWIKGVRRNNSFLIAISSLLMALQVYCSSYLFLFSMLVWGIFVMADFSNSRQKFYHIQRVAAYVLGVLGMILPFLWIYVIKTPISEAINPIQLYHFSPTLCLTFSDLVRPLHNNLIYPALSDLEIDWLYKVHSAFPGLLFLVLSAIALMSSRKYRIRLLMVCMSGFILASGPEWKIGNYVFTAPMFPIYKYADFSNFLRFPVRAFQISLLALSVLAASGLAILLRKNSGKALLILIVSLAVFFAENVPVPFPVFQSSTFVPPPQSYIDFIKHKKNSVVLCLPSRIYDSPRYFRSPIGETAREHIYMYWKTFGNHNVINGSNGYMPKSRIQNQYFIEHLSDPLVYDSMQRYNHIDFIIVAHKMYLYGEPLIRLDHLLKSGRLKCVQADENLSIFECN